MQTGFFYVRVKPDLNPMETTVMIGGKSIFLGELLTKKSPYPVLAVERLQGSDGAKTLYHIPADDNEIVWLPAEFFLFARD